MRRNSTLHEDLYCSMRAPRPAYHAAFRVNNISQTLPSIDYHGDYSGSLALNTTLKRVDVTPANLSNHNEANDIKDEDQPPRARDDDEAAGSSDNKDRGIVCFSAKY